MCKAYVTQGWRIGSTTSFFFVLEWNEGGRRERGEWNKAVGAINQLKIMTESMLRTIRYDTTRLSRLRFRADRFLVSFNCETNPLPFFFRASSRAISSKYFSLSLSPALPPPCPPRVVARKSFVRSPHSIDNNSKHFRRYRIVACGHLPRLLLLIYRHSIRGIVI